MPNVHLTSEKKPVATEKEQLCEPFAYHRGSYTHVVHVAGNNLCRVLHARQFMCIFCIFSLHQTLLLSTPY